MSMRLYEVPWIFELVIITLYKTSAFFSFFLLASFFSAFYTLAHSFLSPVVCNVSSFKLYPCHYSRCDDDVICSIATQCLLVVFINCG